MKLYEVPQGERFLLEGVMYKLNVIDGMYSHCEDLNGKVIHLVAWAEVTLVEAYRAHLTNREAAHKRNIKAFIQEMTAIQIESDQND
jgi:hypothetical protein